MRRALPYLPQLALAVITPVLILAAVTLRDTSAEQKDRQARQAFAVAVQSGARPDIQARNVGGALRQQLSEVEARAGHDARVATWLAAAAALGLVGLTASVLSMRGRPRPVGA